MLWSNCFLISKRILQTQSGKGHMMANNHQRHGGPPETNCHIAPDSLLVPGRDETPAHGTTSDYVNNQTIHHELMLSDSPNHTTEWAQQQSTPYKTGNMATTKVNEQVTQVTVSTCPYSFSTSPSIHINWLHKGLL